MKRLEQFRIYYNRTIYPELVRLERQRRRLLRLVFTSALVLTGLIVVALYLRILALGLVLLLPIAAYIAYLLFRIRKFIRTFKPHVMELVLDFIDDGPNRGEMKYDPVRFLSREQFKESRIFTGPTPFYQGEDFIEGRVGEMDFELCELDVREISPVRNRLDQVFKGVFLHATFPEEAEGEIVVWPRALRQFHSRSIRAFTWYGAHSVDHEILHDEFRELFLTFATEDTHVAGILTEPMQEAIVRYKQQTGKEIFASFLNQKIYIAVTEEKDILEPYLFRSNLSFDLVREFFEDVNLLLDIVEEFDTTH